MSEPLEHATFETIFERMSKFEDRDRTYTQCPWCPAARTRVETMATHINHHHRGQLNGAEELVLDDYLREHGSRQ